MKIAVIGASGYTGIELLRLLSSIADLEINQITSRQYKGKKLKNVFPFFSKNRYADLTFEEEIDLEKSDFFFLCLPHETSLELVNQIYKTKKKIIDLSGAYRLKDSSLYKEFYGFEHKYPDVLAQTVYGLPELFRDHIKGASVVANPGCYPTATILGIYPAVKENILDRETVVVTAYSGTSGAGRELKQQFHYPEAFSDAYAYKPKNHRHIPEIEETINIFSYQKIKIRFTPHILPVSRGMIATINFRTDVKEEQLKDIYQNLYEKEPFIRIVETPSHIKYVNGTNYCDIFISVDERTSYATVISVIDNLGKGASLQAVQNFNLMTQREETQALTSLPIYP
ncbi:MAG: N-acetyl-gamma-glutamyl-phosphate reductase [Aquificae bacterium]|nr:N-acetyl-gamma-glutamyl-phosphate reductase [Aquificota bacterium]